MTIPQEIHDALTRAGGKNLLGQPIYRFAWSGHETLRISNGREYEDFRVVNEDCWLLMKWEPAEFWGSEIQWNDVNWEPGGLYTAGPYPRAGRYRVLNKLLKAEVKDNFLSWVPFTPTRQYVEEVFPGLRAFQELEPEQKAKHIADREKSERDGLLKDMKRSRMDYKGCATGAQVDKKVATMEKYMGDKEWQADVAREVSKAGKGLAQ